MSHSLLFGLQVKPVIARRLHLDRNPLCNLHSKLFQLVNLIRIVRQKIQALYAEITKNLRSDVVFSLISTKSECQICLKRIHAFS